MATTWGIPHPTKKVFPSSRRRAPWAIMNSVSVNSTVRGTSPLPYLPVTFHDRGVPAKILHLLRAHFPVQELLVVRHTVNELLKVGPHPVLRPDRVQHVHVGEVDLVTGGHRSRVGPEGGMNDRV